MLEAMSRVKVYFDNDAFMDYEIEGFILTTVHVTHVYWLVFQGETTIPYYLMLHLKGPCEKL